MPQQKQKPHNTMWGIKKKSRGRIWWQGFTRVPASHGFCAGFNPWSLVKISCHMCDHSMAAGKPAAVAHGVCNATCNFSKTPSAEQMPGRSSWQSISRNLPPKKITFAVTTTCPTHLFVDEPSTFVVQTLCIPHVGTHGRRT